MSGKSDIEIANSITLKPISEIALKAGVDIKYIEQYGKYKAKIDLAFLVDWRRRKPAERRRAHGARLRATLLDALAVHLETNLSPVDNENAITHYVVGERIGIEPNLVPPIWRSRRKHISLTLRRGRA